ncbi:hypothetical protein [Hyalangium minutum]|nr:hypothetical protein [Hyalangium minutum]
MRLPAYLLLPIGGAVLLLAAVLGTWLWPAPSVSIPSGPASEALAPVAVESPPPTLPQVPLSRPAQPVAPPPPSPVAIPVASAPTPVAKPTEPSPTAPAVPVYSQLTNLTDQQRGQLKNSLLSAGLRAAELAERGAKELERQREEAHARGDVAEVNRLDGLLDSYRERMERMRQQRLELAPAQAGPPTQ